MVNLDDPDQIKQVDKANLIKSIELLPEQCLQAWQDVKELKIPYEYKNISNILVNGMGGSALGPQVVKSLYKDSLDLPLEIINSDTLPEYVNEKTLYILSSYSGATEEVLATTDEARKRGAKCLGITTGADLASFFRKYHLPFYLIEPKYNPSGKPRMGIGYSIIGMIGLLVKIGLLKSIDQEITPLINSLRLINSQSKATRKENNAKKMAQKLFSRIVLIIGAEFLTGSAHEWVNQLNENSKNFADYFLIPELNHHLLEGLANPTANKNNLIALFLLSDFYNSRIKKRFSLTEEVFAKMNIESLVYHCQSQSKLIQAIEVIHYASYVNYYLAILNQADPSPIPWVDYFKQKLKK